MKTELKVTGHQPNKEIALLQLAPHLCRGEVIKTTGELTVASRLQAVVFVCLLLFFPAVRECE